MKPSASDWPEVRFADHVDLLAGYAFKSAQFTDEKTDVHLVKGADVQQGYIDWENCRRWPRQEIANFEKFRLNEGDILLAMDRPWVPAGLKWSSVKKGAPESYLVQRVARMRGRNGLLTGYLRYLVGSLQFENYIRPIVTGVNVPHISGKQISDFRFRLPPEAIQSKVIGVLIPYDDLIENNLRRIKILEEIAQNLYREWFVNFRFPGHEKARIVDSDLGKVPEGWEISTISGVCDSLQDGDWIETKDQGGDDYRLLQVSNIGVSEFIEKGNFRFITQEAFDRLHCTEIAVGDILISRMPKPTGRAWLVSDMPWRMITSVDVAIAKPKQGVTMFLLQFLNSADQLALVEQHQTGTTRPRISRRNLGALPIMLPPATLRDQFSDIVSNNYALRTSLRNKNDLLKSARDLLLPKLISGELDVSELDIEISEEAA